MLWFGIKTYISLSDGRIRSVIGLFTCLWSVFDSILPFSPHSLSQEKSISIQNLRNLILSSFICYYCSGSFIFRICGAVFNAAPAPAAQAAASPAPVSTACTWSTPFKWGVRFDGEELQLKKSEETAANAANLDTLDGDITSGHGFGSNGAL